VCLGGGGGWDDGFYDVSFVMGVNWAEGCLVQLDGDKGSNKGQKEERNYKIHSP